MQIVIEAATSNAELSVVSTFPVVEGGRLGGALLGGGAAVPDAVVEDDALEVLEVILEEGDTVKLVEGCCVVGAFVAAQDNAGALVTVMLYCHTT